MKQLTMAFAAMLYFCVTLAAQPAPGQLGRMMALAGYPLGLDFLFLDKDAGTCAGQLSQQLTGAFGDPKLLDELARRCEVVTIDWEFIDDATVAMVRDFVAKLKRGESVQSSRGPAIRSLKDSERTIAGFEASDAPGERARNQHRSASGHQQNYQRRPQQPTTKLCQRFVTPRQARRV